MGASPLELLYAIEKLAPTVIDLVKEVIDAIKDSPTKRDAARKISLVAAKRIVLG